MRRTWNGKVCRRTAGKLVCPVTILKDTDTSVSCAADLPKQHCLKTVFYSDHERNYAVWWDPNHDEHITKARQLFAVLFGRDSYFYTADRVAEPDRFKNAIIAFEQSGNIGVPISQYPGFRSIREEFFSKHIKIARPGSVIDECRAVETVVVGTFAVIEHDLKTITDMADQLGQTHDDDDQPMTIIDIV